VDQLDLDTLEADTTGPRTAHPVRDGQRPAGADRAITAWRALREFEVEGQPVGDGDIRERQCALQVQLDLDQEEVVDPERINRSTLVGDTAAAAQTTDDKFAADGKEEPLTNEPEQHGQANEADGREAQEQTDQQHEAGKEQEPGASGGEHLK